MFIQTQQTPNPNSLKFLTEKKVSLVGPIEFKDKSETTVSLIKNILSINGVTGIFYSFQLFFFYFSCISAVRVNIAVTPI